MERGSVFGICPKNSYTANMYQCVCVYLRVPHMHAYFNVYVCLTSQTHPVCHLSMMLCFGCFQNYVLIPANLLVDLQKCGRVLLPLFKKKNKFDICRNLKKCKCLQKISHTNTTQTEVMQRKRKYVFALLHFAKCAFFRLLVSRFDSLRVDKLKRKAH